MNWLCSNGRVRRVVSVALLLVMVATVFPTAAFAAVSTKDAYYMCQAASSAKIYKKSEHVLVRRSFGVCGNRVGYNRTIK